MTTTEAAAPSPAVAPVGPLDLALVTANVGSIFENPDDLFEIWISCFAKRVVSPRPPALLAVHLQEVGGKRFHNSMCHARSFVDRLASALEPHGLSTHLAFIDDENDSVKFTALGSIYFVHRSVAPTVRIWNFKSACFEPLGEHSRVHFQEDLEPVVTVHKHKFLPDMTPMQRSSRKGFLRTRWQLAESLVPIELINVHLFHDESNFVAMQQFPSLYSEGRRRALQFALDRVGTLKDDNTPRPDGQELPDAFFIFGDFNFRLDTGAVVSWLSEGAEIRETKDESGKLTRQEFHQRTASLTTFTVTTVTTTTASNTSSDSRSTVGVEVNMTERSSAGSSGFILDASSTESHNIAQPETKADDELLLSQQQQCPLQGEQVNETQSRDWQKREMSLRSSSGPQSEDSSEGCGLRRVLTLEKKLFELHEDKAKTRFTSDLTRKTLLSHDKEPEFFKGDLKEFTIQFPPTYPYSESANDGSSFMGTRCPSWCDRVLFGPKARSALSMELIEYDIVGREHCMGDHKPVLLRVAVSTGNGGGSIEGDSGDGEQQGEHNQSAMKCEEVAVELKSNGKRPGDQPVKMDGQTDEEPLPLQQSTEIEQLEVGENVIKNELRNGREKTTRCCPRPKKCSVL